MNDSISVCTTCKREVCAFNGNQYALMAVKRRGWCPYNPKEFGAGTLAESRDPLKQSKRKYKKSSIK
jgi:hypothetical protein